MLYQLSYASIAKPSEVITAAKELQASLNFPPHARCQSRPSIRPTRQYSTNRSKNVPAYKYQTSDFLARYQGKV